MSMQYFCSVCRKPCRPKLCTVGVSSDCCYLDDAPLMVEADRCRDFSPPTWTGHWRDWHRGHNCNLDPTLAGETHRRLRLLTDAEERDLFDSLMADEQAEWTPTMRARFNVLNR